MLVHIHQATWHHIPLIHIFNTVETCKKKMFEMFKLHCTHPCTMSIFQSFAHPFLLKHSTQSPGFRNTGSAAYQPAATHCPGEYQQHVVFPCSHPSKYLSCTSLLKNSDQMGNTAVNLAWTLALETCKLTCLSGLLGLASDP